MENNKFFSEHALQLMLSIYCLYQQVVTVFVGKKGCLNLVLKISNTISNLEDDNVIYGLFVCNKAYLTRQICSSVFGVIIHLESWKKWETKSFDSRITTTI